ncbi:MAG: hypothetical protein HOC21_03265 [Phycisphaerae bacterium]|nr:hypothetical protein [Phycisphaerae bacterium]
MFHSKQIILLLASVICSPAFGDTVLEVPIRGDRLSGIVLPVLPRARDISISGLRANAWTVDDTKRLLLEKNVSVTIGAYIFESEQAVIWINRMPTDAGVVSQIAVYLPTFSKTSKLHSLGAAGENLLVVGSTLGSVTVDVALLKPSKPKNKASLLTTANQRLAQYAQKLATTPTQLSEYPHITEQPTQLLGEETAYIVLPENESEKAWLQPKSGLVSIAADLVELKTGETENIVTLDGNVHIEMRSTSGIDDMQMNAARSIVFLDSGSIRDIASGSLDMTEIHGVYLEGNVVIRANNDTYLVRAPQMYYDFDTGKAIMLESVLRTYGKNGRVPIYVRAKEMKQISQNQWVAKDAQASTSSFATPDLAIGSAQLSITQQKDGSAYIQSSNNTVRFSDTPVFYWPYFAGHIDDIPIKNAVIGFKRGFGQSLETKWDLFSLLGKPEPMGLSLDLVLDGYTDRGVGVGFDIGYSANRTNADLDLYFLSDAGEQRTTSGIKMSVPRHQRGFAFLSSETKLSAYWTLQTQLSYISDSTFMSVWRQPEFRSHAEYETSIYAKYQKDNKAFTALASNDLNGFISTSWLLASRQYKVDKTPELGYYQYGSSIFRDTINWTSELRFMRERMVFQSGTPNNTGLNRNAFLLPDGTAIGGNDAIEDVLTSRGLNEEYQSRFVARQEFTMPLKFGNIQFTPFASIQMNWRLDDETSGPNQNTDYWYRTIGFRATTQFNRIYNTIDNDLLDLHRLRHVIEPYVTVWNGESDIDTATIQQYDARVDNLSTGTAVWFGVKNKLQTWRGGPGRWYQIDWLTIDTALLLASDDATQRYDNPQFFNWRPEYSSLQDAAIVSGKWQYSDGIAFIGNGTWELDGGTLALGSIGAELDHGRDFRTYLEYREIGNTNDQFLSLGMRYKLSKRYSLNFSPTWNFSTDDLQSLRFTATRHNPEFDLTAQIVQNQIQDETTYGLTFKLLKF